MLDSLASWERLDRRLQRVERELAPPPPPEAPRIDPEQLAADSKKVLTLEEFIEPYVNNFEVFCGLVDIVPKSQKRQKLKLSSVQRKYNRARTKRDRVLKPRQVGLTTLELARDIWFFLTRPSSKTVIVCQSITDHGPLKDIARVVRVMFESLAREGLELNWRTFSTHEYELEGREASIRIIEAGASEAAANKKGRGGTIHRLHITECAFFEYAADTLNALMECVPAVEYDSEVIDESTANGAGGYFFDHYRAASEGRSGYTAHFFRWHDFDDYATPLEDGQEVTPANDRQSQWLAEGVTVEQLNWYQKKLAEKQSQDLVDQEYPADAETCFLLSGRGFFDRVVTAAMHAKTKKPIAVEQNGALRIWKYPIPGRIYIASVDPSEGTGGDPGAVAICDRATGEHVATLHGQFPPWKLAELAGHLGFRFNKAILVVERNNHGHAVLQALTQIEFEIPSGAGTATRKVRGYPNIYEGEDEKLGWVSTEISRSAALDALENAQRTGTWSTPDEMVTGEMLTFVVNKKGKAEASPGTHDDLVLVMAIFLSVASKPLPGIRAPAPRNVPSPWGKTSRGFG